MKFLKIYSYKNHLDEEGRWWRVMQLNALRVSSFHIQKLFLVDVFSGWLFFF